MKRFRNMFYHLGFMLIIVATSNGQIDFNDQNLDLPLADEVLVNGNDNNERPFFNEQPSQGGDLVPEPNEVININGPENNDFLPEDNYVPPTKEERPSGNDISPGDQVVSETTEITLQGELNNENNKPPNNENLTPVDNYVPPKDDEVTTNNNIISETTVLPSENVEVSPTPSTEPPSDLTSDKDEVSTNIKDDDDKVQNPNDNLVPNTNEVTPNFSEVPPNENSIGGPGGNDGHGKPGGNDGHGNHGGHRRPRCNKRFGYMPIDGYCDSYVECKNYRPRRKVCPDGMYFNQNARWSEYPCGYPPEVMCRGRNTLTSQPSPYCPHQYGFFFYDSEDIQEQCYQYIMCSAGVPHVMKCPISLVFNPRVGRCDWPEQVPSCKDALDFKCPEEFEVEDYSEEHLDAAVVRNYRHENKCSYFWSCLRGQARMLRCDYGMIFDNDYGRCVIDEFGSCNEYIYPDQPKENSDDEERY